ncbi:MAG: hypothetical protein GY870_19510 [archaeon]|nr:hypothetical protein [archaeon]
MKNEANRIEGIKGGYRVQVSTVIAIAVILRLLVMFRGHNFDFESYLIVGKIVSEGGNVYAETHRYNYGFLFSFVQGSFYYISSFFSNNTVIYRSLIVLTLSLFDIAIGLLILKKYNLKLMMLFLLNPISIIITGYHNQFDNIAIYFSLLGMVFINTEKRFTKQDIIAISFLTLSLITKHLLFIFPIWILFKDNFPKKKKIAYAIVPVFCFFISFIPYLRFGWEGVLKNVFLYRSFNNFPLLNLFFTKVLGLSIEKNYIVIFFTAMICLGFIVKKKPFEQMILYYLLGLVCFSSAVANQYLAIPIISVCILGTRLKYVYFITMGLFLVFETNGLHLYPLFFDSRFAMNLAYTVATWILFAILFYNIIKVPIIGQAYRGVKQRSLQKG